MARDFDGASDFYTETYAPATVAPFTISAFINYDNVTGAFAVAGIGASTDEEFCILVVNGKAWALTQTTGTGNVQAAGATTLSTGTPYHILGVWRSATDREIYVSGTSDGTNTTSRIPTSVTRVRIGQRANDSNQKADGRIWEVGMWNAALDNAEIAALSKGFSPRLIRPASLKVYAPLIGSGTEGNLVTGTALTVSGAPAKANHGRIISPRRTQGGRFTSGVVFDVAANSGDVAAANSYSGAAVWNGSDRALCVDVSMLGPGVTVTAMTYGGANCTLVGAQSTVTSFGRVEQWIIKQSDAGAPAAGSNTLAVTLSGSIEFAVEWTSYTGVHQTTPTEGFNSAQATNGAGATDASVAITSIAANCWVHSAVVASDTSITANQTSRNNISGTLGSGGNEDTGPVVTPGATTMSYTGVGAFVTWAIAGYALRPVAASNGASSVVPIIDCQFRARWTA